MSEHKRCTYVYPYWFPGGASGHAKDYASYRECKMCGKEQFRDGDRWKDYPVQLQQKSIINRNRWNEK